MSYFTWVEQWLQAGKYVGALVSGLPKRNGWTIADQAGDRSPDRTQRLLNPAVWDTFAAMGEVRRVAVAGPEEAARRSGRRGSLAIGALDETGHQSKAERMAMPNVVGVGSGPGASPWAMRHNGMGDQVCWSELIEEGQLFLDI